ncbi:hypothetical protein ACWT_5766 [Actinoplanes sp. SE50]|nr:hypothetical protein ACPL_5897 [Actinoplanes sp. SE50/110]ATO85181.1 hypothetical protein ACWT_5766 [Actinoplanes sp. SE50]SLM02591.1 hypothetical protein ACSP50_5873 [Actinoplanes sp. SE50/110]
MLNTKIHGAVYRGEAQSTPTISKIDLKAKTATITECYDTTKFKLYFTKNNSPVPVPSGPRRGIIETLAKDYGGKKGWMFYKSQALTDPTC